MSEDDSETTEPRPDAMSNTSGCRGALVALETSLRQSLAWVVFEPDTDTTWARARETLEGVLHPEWQRGILQGAQPEDAYFVRCDRTTMTQADIDNGVLICLVGVASVRPAEFVIFRIGQWTADAQAHGSRTP